MKRTACRIISVCLILVVVICTLPKTVYAADLPPLGTYDCTAQTEIPTAECEALVALYNSTGGDAWTNNANWLTTAPCDWYGVFCTNGSVTSLGLYSNGLNGSIPAEIGDFPQLDILSLGGNQLKGSIPLELGNLGRLTYLDLTRNQLSGSIPSQLGNLSQLKNFYLFYNQLSGSIPPELANMTNMEDMHLGNNQLDGKIPDQLGNLSNLKYLFLYDNNFTGVIPLTFTRLQKLESFGFYNTSLCESSAAGFQTWKATVLYWDGTRMCSAAEDYKFLFVPLILK